MAKQKKSKKKWIIISIVVLILFAIVFSQSGGDEQDFGVTTGIAELKSITEQVSASGKIQPEVEVIIGSDVSGEIIYLPYREGQNVKKGDTLVVINPDIYEAALNRSDAALNNSRANAANSRARLSQAEAQFALAEKTWKRDQDLYEKGVTSLSAYETAESNFLTSRAELEASRETVNAAQFTIRSAEASRKESLDNLKRCVILAPRDGTISKLNMEEGERVMGSMSMSITEIMKVANLSAMEVDVDVNENDIVRVNIGDTAIIEADAFLNIKFKGIVTEIANSASSQGMSMDQVTNFLVKIRILPSSYEELLKEGDVNASPFRPGMSANVDILTATVSGIIAVPIESVTTRNDTTKYEKGNYKSKLKSKNKTTDESFTCVFVYEDGKSILRVVETGVQNSKIIEIKSGLKEGDIVITGPYNMINRMLENGKEVEADVATTVAVKEE